MSHRAGDGNFITGPADDQAALVSCWMEPGLGEQTRRIWILSVLPQEPPLPWGWGCLSGSITIAWLCKTKQVN